MLYHINSEWMMKQQMAIEVKRGTPIARWDVIAWEPGPTSLRIAYRPCARKITAEKAQFSYDLHMIIRSSRFKIAFA